MNLDELMEKIKNRPWYEDWYYATYRFFNSVKDFPREVKWFYQRGTRGYADCDVWGLHSYLSGWLPEALRELATNNVGCPSDMYDHKAPRHHECHKWEGTLRTIADGFAAARDIDNMEYFEVVKKPTKELTDEDMKKINRERKRLEGLHQKGMELFAKHYFGLWD